MIVGLSATPTSADFIEKQKFIASDAAAGDRYGTSVSISGNTAIISSFLDDCTDGEACGAAYIYRSDGTNWVQEAKLTASDVAAIDEFGASVSLSGETAVVGAPLDDCTAGDDCGSAYVYRFDGVNWVQEAKLTASDAAVDDVFGISVSIDNDTIIVGAMRVDCAAGIYCGSVYIYRFNGSSWVEEAKLTASDVSTGDLFGRSVFLRRNTVVIGASDRDCSAGIDCGAVYVFGFDGTSWVEEAKLTPSDTIDLAQFGSSVWLDSDRIVVGAPKNRCLLTDRLCGSAYIYSYDGTSWVEEAKLTASDEAMNDLFGGDVTMNGNTVAVGASFVDCAAGDNCGAVYVYRKNGSSWLEDDKLTATDAAMYDNFGYAVSMSSNTIIAGSFRADCSEGTECGAMYVLEQIPGGSVPAASAWGLMNFSLLILIVGTIVIRRSVRT